MELSLGTHGDYYISAELTLYARLQTKEIQAFDAKRIWHGCAEPFVLLDIAISPFGI